MIEGYSGSALVLDSICFALGLGIVWPLQKDRWPGLAALGLFIAAVGAATVAKSNALGGPIRFGELHLVREAFRALSSGGKALTLLAALGIPALFIWNLRRDFSRARLLVLACCLTITAVLCFNLEALHQLNERRGLYRNNYRRYEISRTGILYSFLGSIGEYLTQQRLLAEIGSMPVRPAADFSRKVASVNASRRPNIYLFVLESLVDPLTIVPSLQPDPLDSRLRRSISGYSLSPVFGGKSVEAEFEILCGVPIDPGLQMVTFMLLGKRELPCLPNLLRRAGYLTQSFVAAPPFGFNSGDAYKSLGFERSHFLDAFPQRERDGEWTSTEAYRELLQTKLRSDLESRRPLFTYVFTVSSHTPFALAEKRNPRLQFEPQSHLPTRYLNTLVVNTKEVFDLIDWIRGRDPASVIFVIGDHHPPVRNPGGPLRSFQIPYAFLTETGDAMRTGQILHWEIPKILLGYLEQTDLTRREPAVREVGGHLFRVAPGEEANKVPKDEVGKYRTELEAQRKAFYQFLVTTPE